MTCTRPNSVAPSSPASRPTPSGWPPASLDPGSGRHNQTAVGSRSYKIKIPLSEVSSVSGDCLLGADDVPWSLRDYAYAARQLGRFNGAYLTERPLPAAEWLSRDWLRSWLAEGAAAIDELPRHRAHPLVGRIYPAELSA
jgi:hypothetical protein